VPFRGSRGNPVWFGLPLARCSQPGSAVVGLDAQPRSPLLARSSSMRACLADVNGVGGGGPSRVIDVLVDPPDGPSCLCACRRVLT